MEANTARKIGCFIGIGFLRIGLGEKLPGTAGEPFKGLILALSMATFFGFLAGSFCGYVYWLIAGRKADFDGSMTQVDGERNLRRL